MENNYLIHHGILGMKWGIRRFQNYDGTLKKAGRERYGSGLDDDYSNNTLNAINKKGLGNEAYANDTLKSLAKKGLDDDYSNTTLSSISKKGLDDEYVKNTMDSLMKKGLDSDYSNETLNALTPKGLDDKYSDDWLGVLNNKKGLDDKYSDEWIDVLKKAGINNVETPRELKEKVDKTTMDGKEYVSKALESNSKKFSKDSESKDNLQQTQNQNKQVQSQSKQTNNRSDTDFEKKMGNLNDVYRIANATSNVFKTAKNFSNNSGDSGEKNNRKKQHISERSLSKMSDEDLQKAIDRAQKENLYLSYTNKTTATAKGKAGSGELLDKLAVIASIAGTGVAIAGSIASIKNRNQNG